MKPHILEALLDIHQSKSHSNIIRLDEITDDKLQEILLTVEANIPTTTEISRLTWRSTSDTKEAQ
jgi:hypothetical protein